MYIAVSVCHEGAERTEDGKKQKRKKGENGTIRKPQVRGVSLSSHCHCHLIQLSSDSTVSGHGMPTMESNVQSNLRMLKTANEQ